jgi:hypothetical protein
LVVGFLLPAVLVGGWVALHPPPPNVENLDAESVAPTPTPSAAAPSVAEVAGVEPLPEGTQAPQAPTPRTIELTLQGTPKDARVYDGQTELGHLGDTIEIFRSETTRTLTVRAPGFTPSSLEVTPSENQTHRIVLLPEPRTAPPPQANKP